MATKNFKVKNGIDIGDKTDVINVSGTGTVLDSIKIEGSTITSTDSSAISFGGDILSGVGTPSGASDATTKAYVDQQLAGLSQNSIAQGDSNVTVTDGGIGAVTIAVDGSTVVNTVAAGVTVTGTIESTSTGSFAAGTTVGDITLSNGSITDSSGAISFGDENLTTTGTVTGATGSSFGNLLLGDGSITDSSGSINFGDEDLTTTGDITAAGGILGNVQVGVTDDNTLDTSSGNLTIAPAGGGTTVTGTLTSTAAGSFATGTTVGNMTLANGSITDSSGTIDFDNENLTTTGTVTGATGSSFGNITISDGSITDTSGDISFGDENLTTTGNITAGGSFIIGSASMNETDLEKLDGITNGTAAANKAVVLDGSSDITGINSFTATAGDFQTVKVNTISSDDSASVTIDDGLKVEGGLNVQGGAEIYGTLYAQAIGAEDSSQLTFIDDIKINGTSSTINDLTIATNNVDTVTISTQGNEDLTITADTGNVIVTAAQTDFTANVVINGNLTVNGSEFINNTTNLEIEDNQIVIARNNSSDAIDIAIFGHNYPAGFDSAVPNHTGFFRDATNAQWYLVNTYSKSEDQQTIDRTDPSFSLATFNAEAVNATTFTGALTGNASTATTLETARSIGGVSFDGSANINLPGVNTAGNQNTSGNAGTATAWANGRTITLTGDVTGVSGSFDGTGNLSFATTIAANSVALGTDTTGNYVASITNGSYITGGDGGSEGAGLTLAVDATTAATASKVVARDASGNIAASGGTMGAIKVGVTGDNEIDTTSGNLTIDSAGGTTTIDDNLTVSGNLTVNGTTTTVSTNNMVVTDSLIALSNGTSGTPTNDSGFVVERGTSTNVGFMWDESADQFVCVNTNETGTTAGNVTISSYANLQVNTLTGTATQAQYADLAEKYEADAEYEPGTVVHFGGDKEVSLCDQDMCTKVAGVISTNPAHTMNSNLTAEHVATVALVGRVPVKVTGPIAKGDMLVSAGNGMARAEANPSMGSVIGKALESNDSNEPTVIEVVVGRL